MSGLSSTGEAALMAAIMTGRFISLHTADPGNTGANEVTTVSTAYLRLAQGTFTGVGNNPTVYSNDADLAWAIATLDWGTITHFGIWSLVAGGTFYGGYALTASKTIANGDAFRIPAGSLVFGAD